MEDSPENKITGFKNIKFLLETVRALNSPIRQKILSFISDNEEVNVSDIIYNCKLAQVTASQQLAVLRRYNLVVTKKVNRSVYYRCNYFIVNYVNEQGGFIKNIPKVKHLTNGYFKAKNKK